MLVRETADAAIAPRATSGDHRVLDPRRSHRADLDDDALEPPTAPLRRSDGVQRALHQRPAAGESVPNAVCRRGPRRARSLQRSASGQSPRSSSSDATISARSIAEGRRRVPREPRLHRRPAGKACDLSTDQLRDAQSRLSCVPDQTRIHIVIEVANLNGFRHQSKSTCVLACGDAMSHHELTGSSAHPKPATPPTDGLTRRQPPLSFVSA